MIYIQKKTFPNSPYYTPKCVDILIPNISLHKFGYLLSCYYVQNHD